METRIELTPEAQRILHDLQTLPEWGMHAIAVGMAKANEFAIANIQKDHLTGTGPFPPEEHKLGVVTGRLRGSANASTPVIHGQEIETGIGSNVVYARIHELGGTIHRAARSGSVRLRTDASGELMRQHGHQFLAVFAAAGHKRAKEVKYEAEAYDIEMPARAPFATGIEESLDDYGRVVSLSLVKAWEEQGGHK